MTESEKVFRRIEAEISDITQWYWFLVARRWFFTLGRWMFWVFFGIYMMCFGLVLIFAARNSYKTANVQQTYRHVATDPSKLSQTTKPPLVNKPMDKITHEETSAWKDIWELLSNKRFLTGVGFVLGVIGLERLMFYLFPKAIFDIGKEKQRHQRLKSRRKWIGGIITTIIVLSVIVPYLKQMFWGNTN